MTDGDFKRPGVWIINRCPEILDNFPVEHPGQELWLLSEDVWYETMTPERGAKLDRYICLCESHAWTIRQHYPYLADKVCVGANGIKMELIREIEKDPPVRNPHKMIFASSPDRGLLPLLKIFRRARWYVPDLELHCFYGFNNIEEVIKQSGSVCPQRVLRDEIMKEMDQPGVVWHGRTTQPELYREWFSAGIWCHPSAFTETNCITCQEAQAMGAIPIFKPVWAIGEYCAHGVLIHGDSYMDPLTQARYAGEIFRIASQPELQEKIRPEMMKYARNRFNWERSIDILESWMYGYSDSPAIFCQFAFQNKHAVGSGDILNVGCAEDPADLKRLGAVNLDINPTCPLFGRENKPDIVADCRDLPGPLNGARFDTVVLGEILEHFEATDVPDVLRKAALCLRPGGKIVITVPDDHRPTNDQHAIGDGTEQYTDGVHACHTHRVTREMIEGWMEAAGLWIVSIHEIDYGHFTGHGVVARPVMYQMPTSRQWAESAECNCDKALGERFPELWLASGHQPGCPKHILWKTRRNKEQEEESCC